MLKVTILDGYVDEPTCLGVPPYISPYPRYIAGAILSYDKKTEIHYVTIDQIRKDNTLLNILSKHDLIIVIAGMSVPGKYLSGMPISPNEIVNILSNLPKTIKVLCGPAAQHGFGIAGGKRVKETNFVKKVFDLIVKGDGEFTVFELLKNRLEVEKIDTTLFRENAGAIRNFAIKGVNIVCQHPFFPDYLIAEIETYRGCPRSIVGGCSFCSEPSKGPPDFRPIRDIVDEIQALYKIGVRHFRLGNQPCIFSYMAKDSGKLEFPKPNPIALEQLFKGIRSAVPNLKTLHVDNANPGIIARYPKECEEIAKTIIKNHTPGDVAAFGVESVDPMVIKKNNLKATADEVYDAIKLLNKIGSKRGDNGMPELLPGLNFLFGLDGETKKTFDLDYEFLKKVLDDGFLLRRINLRQVIPIPNTKMFGIGNKIISKHKNEFQSFKRRIRENIERPMIEKILPRNTILKNVFTEMYEGKTTFGRQIGSYPLLVGIPGVLMLHKFFDVKIIDYGYRSVTAIPFPLDINTAKRETIEAIPNVGQKRAIKILVNRPFRNRKHFLESLDDQEVANKILEYIKI
ncbi:MAG: radical SAM protein [Candidatus Thermoplasmatota archaeon]|jgi:radical SAM superfamily enzyme with C-terminal helix-hairpin-helix motif|nr:radical SAM protein [Candidatus Thermoplasmatota archaeon]